MGVRDLAYRLYEHRIEASLSPQAIPRHVGVMCDGNRRWARSAGLADVSSGHQAGADKIFEVLQWCRQTGVEVVTLLAALHRQPGPARRPSSSRCCGSSRTPFANWSRRTGT